MFFVEIAGVVVAIDNRYDYIERLCVEYRADASPDECAFSVSATPEEISAENTQAHAFSEPYCEALALYRKICARMINHDAFLFHAAVVAYQGRAYAFAAKSGTGKSTQVSQWMRALGSAVTVINGDKPLLRWWNNGFVACGTPFKGKEGWGENTSAPLSAICFVERCAPGEPDALLPLRDDGEIVRRIMSQVLLPEDALTAARFLGLLDKLVSSVPFYLLHCTPTEAAFEAAFRMTERALTGHDSTERALTEPIDGD